MKEFIKKNPELGRDSLFIFFVVMITLIILKNTLLQNMFYKQEFKANDLYYNYISNNSIKGSIDETSKLNGAFSYGPYINLKKGDYIVTVNYKATYDNTIIVTGGKGDFGIIDKVLSANKTEYSFPLKMIYDEKQEGLGVGINYGGKGTLQINSIEIKKENNINEFILIFFYGVLIFTIIKKFKGESKSVLAAYASLMYMLLSSIFIRNIPFLILVYFIACILLHVIKKKKLLHNENFLIHNYLVLLSFLIMFLCSKSSAFYVINDWVDTQCYFTMGKALVNGQAIYKDLFEQKGPLLFLLYGIGYLICKTELYGIYFLESISFAILLIFSFKLSSLFLHKKIALLSSLLFLVCMLKQNFFRYGGSCEEFILPFKMISLYFFIKYFKEEKDEHDPKIMFIHGVLGACVLLMKFNIGVFWGGFGIVIFLRMIYKKQYKSILKNIAAVSLGAIVIIIPFIIYFFVKDCFKDFIEAYITFNFKYASVPSTPEASFIYKILDGVLSHYKGFIIVGTGIFIFMKTKSISNHWCKWGLFLSFIFLVSVIYLGGKYPYYFLVIADFVIFFSISALYHTQKNINFLFNKQTIIGATTVLLLLAVNFNCDYKQSKLYNSSITVQEKFACIIHQQSDNPTLLNFLWLDSGFYTKAEILPNIKFFHKLNMPYEQYPDNFDVQRKAVKNKEVQFVATRDFVDSKVNIPELINNYFLISEQIQEYEGKLYKYYLFKAYDEK